MRLLLIITLFLLPVFSFAQQNAKKPFSMQTAMHYQDSIFDTHIGEQYPIFFFNAHNGSHLDNESIKGKVTLLTFFCDQMGCWDIQKLQSFYDEIKDDGDIAFMAVCFGLNDLSAYIQKYHITFPVVNVTDYPEVQRLNFHAGFPSFVIIDKEGKVASVRMARIDDEGFATISPLALCNKIADVYNKSH